MEMHSTEIGQISEALAKAQGQIQGAMEDSKNPFFKSDYADLTSVWKACKKPLSENGLAVFQSLIYDNGIQFVITTLSHSSGQWFKSMMQVKPNKDDMQALGAAITYARRFSLSALIGMYPKGEDDDAESTMDRDEKPINLVIPHGYDHKKVDQYIDGLSKHYGKGPSTIKKQAMDNPKSFWDAYDVWLAKKEKTTSPTG